MQCPGCQRDALKVRHRVLAAARAETRCPSCGAIIRFGFWPRIVHTIFGDLLLVGGMLGALVFRTPFLVPLTTGMWLLLALTLPIEAKGHPVSVD